jgi:hypothetical protein
MIMKYIIDFVDNTDRSQVEQYLLANNLTIISNFSFDKKVFLVEGSALPSSDVIVESIIVDNESPIELLSNQNFTFNTDSNEDWWKTTIVLKPQNEIENYARRGENSVVYLLDSGVNGNHQEFAGTNFNHLYSFNNDFDDYNGHGTALASLIIGNTCGITCAELQSVKIFQSGTTLYLSQLLSAFDAIYTYSLTCPEKLHVINMSWNIPKNEYVESKIDALVNVGLVAVTSAGNNGMPIENVTPGGMDKVITIGAFNQNLEPCDFSNYTGEIPTTNGPVNYGTLDGWAPGEFIKCAIFNSTDNYGFLSGTSMAAAIHSAAIAYNNFGHLGLGIDQIDNDTRWYFIYRTSFDRKNFLSLTGVYENSVNQITTLRCLEDTVRGVNYGVINAVGLYAMSSMPVVKQLSLDYVYKKFTINQPLPEGFYLKGNWLIGQKAVEEFYKWEGTITYTKIDDTEFTVPMFISIGMTETPPNYQAINVTLTPPQGCYVESFESGGFTYYYCATLNCIGSCINCAGGISEKDPFFVFCVCSANESCP